jgi:hypothetical protein
MLKFLSTVTIFPLINTESASGIVWTAEEILRTAIEANPNPNDNMPNEFSVNMVCHPLFPFRKLSHGPRYRA